MAEIEKQPQLDKIYTLPPHSSYVKEGAVNTTIKVGDQEIVAPSEVVLPAREDWQVGLKKPASPQGL